MGSINRSHNEADGGILLFNGELILLYCDSVHCEIGGKESVKGRIYLTTHRLVMITTPYRQSSAVKSLCAPFCAISKCSVEQPVFGANYIEITVRDEADSSKSFSFKLKFTKGGAIELAMAMNRAIYAVGRNTNPTMAPPAYTPSPSEQYYQAPPTAYAPGYNCGVQMPVQQFPDQPPIGFIYASSAPPPYPGLGVPGGGQQQPPQQAYGQPHQQAGGYPVAGAYPQPGQQQPPFSGYPQQASSGYPQQPPVGYPQQPPTGYPHQQSFPGYPQQQAFGGYPQQPQQSQQSQQPSSGYPSSQVVPGYEQANPPEFSRQPGAPSETRQTSSGYPTLPGQPAGPPSSDATGAAWPTAPGYNPNWKD